jgi:hypothetical protein
MNRVRAEAVDEIEGFVVEFDFESLFGADFG